MHAPSFLALGPLFSIFQGVTATSPTRLVEIAGINTNNVTIWDCPSTTWPDLDQTMLQIAMNDFAYSFYTEKNIQKALDRYVASNYVQHNPDIPDGRAAAAKFLIPLFGKKGNSFEVARVMVGPEYTTIHIKAKVNGSFLNVVDIYKTKGSCIVEHWDVMQPVQNNTVSHHPYF
ncbi:hypothetical protein FBEOM_6901 [Fusarium beomiforme]|uniref:SnoaL-like domain-containing protein n=1 Tax=Fusarium beomiforme TaxID=44412 RepID=A0A9P5AID4_9HYPO|nr:hypothetical protein FBEOM_6901 [Fusarium beomiforme]